MKGRFFWLIITALAHGLVVKSVPPSSPAYFIPVVNNGATPKVVQITALLEELYPVVGPLTIRGFLGPWQARLLKVPVRKETPWNILLIWIIDTRPGLLEWKTDPTSLCAAIFYHTGGTRDQSGRATVVAPDCQARMPGAAVTGVTGKQDVILLNRTGDAVGVTVVWVDSKSRLTKQTVGLNPGSTGVLSLESAVPLLVLASPDNRLMTSDGASVVHPDAYGYLPSPKKRAAIFFVDESPNARESRLEITLDQESFKPLSSVLREPSVRKLTPRFSSSPDVLWFHLSRLILTLLWLVGLPAAFRRVWMVEEGQPWRTRLLDGVFYLGYATLLLAVIADFLTIRILSPLVPAVILAVSALWPLERTARLRAPADFVTLFCSYWLLSYAF